jgi:hypothetical protein
MKQIDVCLDRHFLGQQPLKAKWQARWHKDYPHILVLFHYQHIILVVDMDEREILHRWAEVQADKRGLNAAINYLNRKWENEDEGGKD